MVKLVTYARGNKFAINEISLVIESISGFVMPLAKIYVEPLPVIVYHPKGFVCLMLGVHLVNKEEWWGLLVWESPHASQLMVGGWIL